MPNERPHQPPRKPETPADVKNVGAAESRSLVSELLRFQVAATLAGLEGVSLTAEIVRKVSRMELEKTPPVSKLTVAEAVRATAEVLQEITSTSLDEWTEVPAKVVNRFQREYDRLERRVPPSTE